MELNSNYHTPEEIRQIMGRLTGPQVGEGFTLFPPFYTDFGKNIAIGRNVFINSGCHFQDQGGITIGDGALIGHNVVLATVNHALEPEKCRRNRYAPIRIGENVWIGSNATILPGVTLGDWAVVGGAGAHEGRVADDRGGWRARPGAQNDLGKGRRGEKAAARFPPVRPRILHTFYNVAGQYARKRPFRPPACAIQWENRDRILCVRRRKIARKELSDGLRYVRIGEAPKSAKLP